MENNEAWSRWSVGARPTASESHGIFRLNICDMFVHLFVCLFVLLEDWESKFLLHNWIENNMAWSCWRI